MRIRLLSDLHLEAAAWTAPSVTQDVVVLAGDIHNGYAGIRWAAQQFDCPVLYVPGNHEFYGAEMLQLRQAWAQGFDLPPQVRVLDDRAVEIGGVRFIGSTLWTDFALYGDVERAMAAAARSMADYALIRYGERLLSAPDTLRLHRQSVAWLSETLSTPFAGKSVVLTHHCPHRGSIDPQFEDAPTNPAFVSDLTGLILSAPISLWCHGHTHASRDYVVGGTRVVCNPRGYPYGERFENPHLVPDLLIEI